MKIYLGSDHAGYTLKEAIKEHLLANGYLVEDLGAVNYDPIDDYPDKIFPVAEAVARDRCGRQPGAGADLGSLGQAAARPDRPAGIAAPAFLLWLRCCIR